MTPPCVCSTGAPKLLSTSLYLRSYLHSGNQWDFRDELPFCYLSCTSFSFAQWGWGGGLAHPALQLGGELGLEPAGCSFTVVPLDEDFVGQRSAAPQLLQVMELWGEGGTESR